MRDAPVNEGKVSQDCAESHVEEAAVAPECKPALLTDDIVKEQQESDQPITVLIADDIVLAAENKVNQ